MVRHFALLFVACLAKAFLKTPALVHDELSSTLELGSDLFAPSNVSLLDTHEELMSPTQLKQIVTHLRNVVGQQQDKIFALQAELHRATASLEAVRSSSAPRAKAGGFASSVIEVSDFGVIFNAQVPSGIDVGALDAARKKKEKQGRAKKGDQHDVKGHRKDRKTSTTTPFTMQTMMDAYTSGNDTIADALDIEKKGLREGPMGLDMYYLYGSAFVLLPIAILLVVLFEVYHRSWVGVDFDIEPYGEQEQNQDTAFSGLFRGFWELTGPYFTVDDPPTNGRTYLAIIFTLAAVMLYFLFIWNAWQKQFWDAFQEKNYDKFLYLMLVFIVMVIVIVLIATYADYMRQMLYIDWRGWLTDRYLRRWMANHLHYIMQVDGDLSKIDNPDQRIQEDLDKYVSLTISLSYNFAWNIGTLCVFLPLLWILSPKKAFGMFYLPGWLVYVALAFSIVGTLVTHLVGSQLMRINFARQRMEADFRFQLVRVRDNSESVAVYNSEETERHRFDGQFERIRRVWWEYMTYNKRLQYWISAYGLVSFLYPFMILAPNYFNGDITLGDLFQIYSALNYVGNAFDWIINVYQPLTDWRATCDRLLAFDEASVAAEKATEENELIIISPAEGYVGADFWAQKLTIALPGGKQLWENAELRVAPADRVLISGPAGRGKSTLFRALAGVWPYSKGEVRTPSRSPTDVLCLPQKPYIPSHVTLRTAVCYPQDPNAYTDEAIGQALIVVKLTDLLERKNEKSSADSGGGAGLDRIAQWDHELSPGEQQRLRVAHVLLQRPRFLFLDEATASIDEDTTIMVYQTLVRELPEMAIISISHDVKTLKRFHRKHFVPAEKENVLRRA
mmetsp:Transcript_13363/g.29934  ORF Transcript_13363/g.29934 Transcript_13363/m.29934 type:complete len:844 (-) Transcript_13363:203-2734(-)